ncbi:MAG TPA: hypothetical protein VNP93_03900, partial [Gaiellaceae bacterium]|nr:hypothetical protein [Gaiellaceae bacterium]
MPSATAAVPVRPLLLAVFFAVLATFVFAASADGGRHSWSTYLAPASACAGSTDATAPAAVQRRAVTCLMNYARVQHRRGRLAQSPTLRLASVLKGQKVASCGQFSHTPCGSDATAPVKAAGYRYASFGENLYGGAWGSVTP